MAIAYVLHKTPYVFPIIGGRKVEHLHANIEALEVSLTPEHLKYLESILPFSHGFPYEFFVRVKHVASIYHELIFPLGSGGS